MIFAEEKLRKKKWRERKRKGERERKRERERERDSEKIKLFKKFFFEVKNQMLRYILNTC